MAYIVLSFSYQVNVARSWASIVGNTQICTNTGSKKKCVSNQIFANLFLRYRADQAGWTLPARSDDLSSPEPNAACLSVFHNNLLHVSGKHYLAPLPLHPSD